jgi:hypothetical protein
MKFGRKKKIKKYFVTLSITMIGTSTRRHLIDRDYKKKTLNKYLHVTSKCFVLKYTDRLILLEKSFDNVIN